MDAKLEATMETKKCHPSRDILQVRRACPGCGITMSYHALSYKHFCRGGPDAKRRRRLEQLDARIEQRLGAGGKLEQQAVERVQGEGRNLWRRKRLRVLPRGRTGLRRRCLCLCVGSKSAAEAQW